MKSFVFFLLMSLFHTSSFAQAEQYSALDQKTKDSLTYEASNEMGRFSKNVSIGAGLILFGGVICIAAPKVAKDPSLMFGIGGVLIVVGGVMTLSAPNHIANAASLLAYSSGFNLDRKPKRSKR